MAFGQELPTLQLRSYSGPWITFAVALRGVWWPSVDYGFLLGSTGTQRQSSPCRSVRRHVCLPKRLSLLTRFPTAGSVVGSIPIFHSHILFFPTILLAGLGTSAGCSHRHVLLPSLVMGGSSMKLMAMAQGFLIKQSLACAAGLPQGRPFLRTVLATLLGHLPGGAALLV